MSILDVGSGARPTVPPDQRPADCTYVGLDVSGDELDRAGPAAYQEMVIGDISSELPSLTRRFDLVLSWQVLEHVPSLRGALASQRAALAPGGQMVALLSGAWAIYAIAARIIPYRISTPLQARMLGIEPRDKFPTHYDGCTDRQLRRLLREGGWSSWEIEPRYKAGGYLRFSHVLQSGYLRYEDWAARRPYPNLATHYILEAAA